MGVGRERIVRPAMKPVLRSRNEGLASVKTLSAAVALLAALSIAAPRARAWTEDDFEHRPLVAYAMPSDKDNIIGQPLRYTIQKGDTLLDVGRWYGLSATEISQANHKLDWWTPPVGEEIVLPAQHILPEGPHEGIVLNIPEMRVYYFPQPYKLHHRKGRLTAAASSSEAQVVYTFPVGLGRFDWKTPVGDFRVRGKTRNPTWVVPKKIYEEHLERDGFAEHVVKGGEPDNPLGLYRLELTLPEYALHGTNVPWGIGMEVSHGCVRLYPEDIERLFSKVRVGTPGRFVYQPVKYGWRDGGLYVEVHRDLYGKYPALWSHAVREARRLGIADQIDYRKLQRAVTETTGMPTYIMEGTEPDSAG